MTIINVDFTNTSTTAAHGMGAQPRIILMRVKFVNAVGGYAINDEIDAKAVLSNDGSYFLSFGANATDAWYSTFALWGAWPAGPFVINKTGGGRTTLNPTDVTGKIYLWR